MFAGRSSRLLAVSGKRGPFAGLYVDGAVELVVAGTLFSGGS